MSAEDLSPRELLEKVVSLRELVDERDVRYEQRFKAMDEKTGLALTSSEKAVAKAEIATEKRFDCVEARTPILCADLVWRPAGELLAGDEIVAFDEESLTRRERMFRKAEVISNSLAEDKLLLVQTPKGDVRCNRRHPWLVRRPRTTRSGTANGIWEWIKASELKIGDEVLYAVDLWGIDDSWEAGWLAGMFDGEGCLCLNKNGGAQLSIAQRESETSSRVSEVLKRILQSFVTHRQEAGTRSTVYNTLPFFHFIISARVDIMKILGTVRPPRLISRSDGVWEDKPIGGKNRRTFITEIMDAGVGTVAVLGTTTKTFIGAGFAMHNSVNEFRGQLKDQAATLLPRAEADVKFNTFSKDIEELKKSVLTSQGRSSGFNASWGIAISVALLAIALIGLILRAKT